ncbi:MAG: patatin-like phospholipase family protein [Terracidiphilus sp.]|nr:patatin-like phospholipase family protein [Terracidiphilus sp.]
MARFFPRAARFFALALATLAAVSASAQQPVSPASLPPVAPAGRPAIGLALEGGGALGLAHIGVLQWMEDNRVPVDRLAGTSMGSLVGALYASGSSPAQLRAIATGNAFESVFTLQSPYADSSFRRRQDRREMPQALAIGMRHHPLLRNALLADRGVNEFLAAYMPAYNTAALDFDRLPIPFRCVATDLNTLGPVVFSSGPLPSAVRASISIPGVFPPVLDGRGHSLVDGGIMNNLPADIVRHDLHADIVIAVHLDSGGPVAGVDTSSIVSVLNRAFSAGIEQNVQASMRHADLVLVIPVEKYSGADYNKGGQLIREGYLAAERNRAALIKYALDPAAWDAYLAARRSRLRPDPGLLRAVRVEGGDPSAQQSALVSFEPFKGQPIRPATAITALKPIQSNGGYQANYQTFFSQPASSQTQPDDGILVHLTKDPIGPPYLLIGPEIAATTSNPLRIALNLRLVAQNLGNFGSELRATARLGYMTSLSTEYYRLLTPSGYYFQPIAGVSRDPVFVWASQKRIAERSRQNVYGGLELGRTFGNHAQVAAQWRAQDTRWSLITGSGGGPYLTGTAQTGQLRFSLDRMLAGAVSPSGWRLSASAGTFYHAVQSSNAPMAQLAFSSSHAFKNENIFSIGGEASSYFRANVAQPFRFTIGGPMRLSASAFDEFRGTDIYLARAGYLRRLAALPTGLGQGLYGTIGYEAGQVWSPEQKSVLRQNGTVGLIGNTPIGLVTFGFSVGDAGHRKVFLTVGRWF